MTQTLNCTTSIDFILMSPEVPTISDLLVANISGCHESDGIIQCIATGSNLEYSLDGLIWQSDDTFSGLSAGDYTVFVRSNSDDMCISQIGATIDDFEITEIISVAVTHPSDCDSDNGIIVIEATGENLEFSVDNGSSWTDSNSFDNLSQGTYPIIVRSKDDPSCTDTITEELIDPSSPIIENIDITPISDCDTSDGSVSIQAEGLNLEYSIDEGNSWQSSETFENLEAGVYSIWVRSGDYPNCISLESFSLSAPDCPCNDIEVFYDMLIVNCNDPNSGEITITNITGLNSLNPEILWSNGAIGDINSGIPEGEYIFTVNYDNDCTFSDTIELASMTPISFELVGTTCRLF